MASIASLKEEGSRAFVMKDYAKAVAAWDKALEHPEATDGDISLIHNNKAAYHMVQKQFREAIGECNKALEIQPEYVKALVRRAKAYEQLAQYKDALSDLQKAASLGNEDARKAEQRVKGLLAGKKPAGMSGGLGKKKLAAARGSAANNGQRRTIPVKLTMGNDTRAFQLAPSVTYAELLEHAHQLFPKSGPFVLKHLDKEGDLVTIASRADIIRAIEESIEAGGRGMTVRGAAQASISPVRLHAIKVSSKEEVPKAPAEEGKYMQNMIEQFQKLQKMTKKSPQQPETHEAPMPQVQVDEWILAFVELLKEHCNLDPDRPIEAQEIGNERLTAAFQAMMLSDPKADELLDSAHDKFQEQTALGMVCQAQVHDARATNIMQKAASDGSNVSDIAADVESLFEKAEKKVDEAIAYCSSVLDAYVMKSQIEQGRAKLAANYLLQPVKPSEHEDPAEQQALEEAASKEAVAKAFARVTKESAASAAVHMEKAYTYIQQAIDAMPEEEKSRELKPLKPMAEQIPGDPASETPLKATLMINLGNAYYEQSILNAAGGLDWRPLIIKAREIFIEAGAADVDIRNALKGHPMSEELTDLIGKEPKEKNADPKGVPSLKPRKKK